MFNKRKFLISVILLLALSIVIAGCTSSGEPTRDLSTPSTRLVGHWGFFRDGISDPVIEWWVGVVDEEGSGSFTQFFNSSISPTNEDEIIYLKYQVISESGDKVTLDILQEDLTNLMALSYPTYELTQDGQILISDFGELQYIDSKTEP